ncbi:MAG TPA: SDR family oxidoreductase [Terriglobales bacterium]|nr:SDR family oxidoreductase [Terriglobales bacterium]
MASILITGTSTGIGLETALTLGRTGHTVYATMRNPARAPELGDKAAHERLPIKISVMDVDSDSSVKTAIADIHKDAGHIDVLVNNAGVERNGSVEELPLDEFRAVMETNYFGAIRCIQEVVPHMRRRKSGCVINVSSVAGRIATSPLAPYTASKFALEALSEALAQEMKTFNVRVAVVQPGIIDTPMARRLEDPSNGSQYAQQRRFGHLFAAALKNPASPSLVAQKIQEIIESGTWQLRHPVGPDALPFLGWRNSMTDEQWVDIHAADDETWYKRMEHDFGLTIRPKN